MRCVPLHFKSYQEYDEVFLPIFLEETKAQLHRAKFAERGPTEKVQHHRFATAGKKDEYVRLTLLRGMVSEDMSYNRGDIVLISENEDPMTDCRAHALCYVDSLRGEELSVIMKLDSPGSSGKKTFRERSRLVAARIAKGDEWWLTKICSVSTASREFAALRSLRNVDPKLRDFILNKSDSDGKPMEVNMPSFRVSEDLWKCIEDNYNQFQVEAIRQARKKAGVSLCLGPPGTGKTTTILGMLSVLLGRSEDQEEDDVTVGRFSRHYGGRYEADRIKRILAGETPEDEIMISCDEENEVVCLGTPERVQKSDMMRYAKIGSYSNWMDEIPENPLQSLSLLAHKEYSQRNAIGVRTLQVGSAQEAMTGEDKKMKNRILVCAPSNAAIDEIVRRIVGEGLWGRDGEKFIPNVVRVGPNLHPSLAQYSLERMAQAVNVGVSTNLLPQAGQAPMGQDQQAKASVLRDAQIVCTTLSVAGSADLRLLKDAKFETVVIDEASQSIELSTLIPLQMGCCRLVLVGDHKQLPATVFSRIAESHLYNRSLFERLHQSGYPMCVLKRQMRMHPEIAKFPSELFYGGEIEDAPNILDLVTDQEWTRAHPTVFGPLVFFDIEEGKETVSLQSKVNEEEAAFVECIIATLMKRFPADAVNKIVKRTAVVSPYAEQVRLITDRLRRLFGVVELTKPCPIEVNTVDGFQGREKDIIIASTVRASEGSIGFLADIRRMNVMLTRARTNMWIVGHRGTLAKDPSSPWAKLVQHIDNQKKVVKVTHPIQSFFPRVLPSVEESNDIPMNTVEA